MARGMTRLAGRAWFVVVVVALLLSSAFAALARSARAEPTLQKATKATKNGENVTEDMLADGDIDAEDLVGRATVGRAILRTPPGGQTYVSLAGFTRTTIFGEHEV